MSSVRGMTRCQCCDVQILVNSMSGVCGRCFWALRVVNNMDIKCTYHDKAVITARDDNVITR